MKNIHKIFALLFVGCFLMSLGFRKDFDKNNNIKHPYPKPFPLEGKGLYILVRKVLPLKGKDLGWGISYYNLTPKPIQLDSLVKIDESTGLIVSEHLNLVIANCTGCHSSKLITQFHTDRQGWLEKIRWMQQKQKLWDLGESEPKILDYLAKNYPPSEKVNRRAALKGIEWYRLNRK